ncbi:sensor histidine kinase [Sphingobacterium sp. ML3W]|uniref:sensor histidine kinase n=1 Tax=Sphingobacterium sp. ML3W TaxID=1538644 RepID=UPI00130E109B|nr:HAMP domain-containing sensor histidine kinase [Sphingobacterium sp. ML3W]
MVSQYDYLSKTLSSLYEEALITTVDKYRAIQFSKLPKKSQGISLKYNFENKSGSSMDSLINTDDYVLQLRTESEEEKLTPDQVLYKINSYAIANAPFDITELDSIMSEVMKEKDILCDYDLIVYSSKESKELDATNRSIFNESSSTYSTSKKELDITRDVQMYYENPASIIFQKMLYYLMFSAIVLIVVIWAVYYQWQIIQKQKMIETVRQDFVDSMTHELRHPLQGALSVAEVMENPSFMESPERRSKAISRIKTNLDNIDQLLESIVIKSYSEELWFEPQLEVGNLHDVINEVITSFALNYIKRVDFVTYFDENLTDVIFDPIHLPNAIKNLIDNSIKYSKEKVRIEISVILKEKWIHITVGDNGLGVKEKDLPKIFKKFYKIEHSKKNHGLGLGLSYVEWVCKMHKGNINVESKYNEGSKFTISIPFINE